MDMNEALRSARREQGIKAVTLAEHCGCSRAFVSMMEHGKKFIPLRMLAGMPPNLRRPVIEAGIATLQAQIADLEVLLPAA